MSNTTLINSNFAQALMAGANLRGATLQNVDFSGAELQGASLAYVKDLLNGGRHRCLYPLSTLPDTAPGVPCTSFRGAFLKNASLYRAWFFNGNFESAGMDGASLYKTTFQNTNLEGAYMMGATVYGTNFYNAKMRGARLENARFDSETQLDKTVCGFRPIVGKTTHIWCPERSR